MPVRNMIYDAINYGKQIKEISKMHRKEGYLKSGSEFLSGFSKDDKLIPVITLTVYWGVEVWDAPRSLDEMIKLSKDEDRMNEAITTKAIYKNLEREAVRTIEMFTGIEFDVNEEDDKMDMCKAWVDHKQAGIIEGRTEGRAEGRAEEIVEMGYEFGLSREDVLLKLQEKLHISATKAKEYLQEFGK